MQNVVLNNGLEMPILGYGTFQIFDKNNCRQCIYEAIKAGYRLFDTASSYGNEDAVGEAIADALRDGIAERKELFIATKVWVQDSGYEATRKAYELSLKRLGLDYLDLYLIHQPLGDYYGSWRAMEELEIKGEVKSIGVCNFMPDRLVDLCLNSRIRPAVNQIEIHPFLCREADLKLMKGYSVLPMAWGPLSEGQHNIFENSILIKLAKKYRKTSAQIVLRWHIQRGVAVIPKTIHKERMKENIDIWDFELKDCDMKAIERLDIGHSEIIDHRSAYTAKWLNERKIHD